MRDRRGEAAEALAVPVVGARFYEPGVGVVVGLDLADGRCIVVAKAHRSTFTPFEELVAIERVQHRDGVGADG